MQSLSQHGILNKVTLAWVARQERHQSNDEADKLTRERSSCQKTITRLRDYKIYNHNMFRTTD